MNTIVGTIAAIAVFTLTNSPLAQTPAGLPPNSGSVRAMPAADVTAEIARMDEQMRKMQEQHARMMSARTPEERQKWMDEQHRSIEEGMAMMARMLQDSRMTGGVGARKAGQPMPSPEFDPPMQWMMKGIEMMQLMTQLMMDQLGITRGDSGAVAGQR